MADALTGTVTALETSVYGQITNRVITDIRGLSLDEIGSRVHFRMQPWDKNLTFPACVVSQKGDVFQDSDGPIATPVVRYQINVVLVRAANRDLVSGAAPALLWRENISHLYRKTRPCWTLTGASLQYARMLGGGMFQNDAETQMLDVSWLLIEFVVKEPN